MYNIHIHCICVCMLCVCVYELHAVRACVCACCAGEADGLRLPGRTTPGRTPASRQQLGTAAQMSMINVRIVMGRTNKDETLLNFKFKV